ncbi:MAG TPA: SprT family zinc-dependent metalloprotease [Steroidobacteraceae bacterium]
MSIDTAKHLWNLCGITMQFERRNIKNLRIGIYAPHGEVRVAAPRRMAEATVRNFVISRLGWIVRKRSELQHRQVPPAPQLVSGEVHYYQGRPHVLEVSEIRGTPAVRRNTDATLQLRIPAGSDAAARLKVLNHWYRRELGVQLAPLLQAWEARLGIKVAQLRIRQMRTRWGSCNARSRRVCLNLDLIRRSPRCLEYVLVHELVHFFERGHNARFYRLMDELLPEWRDCRAELNRQRSPT